MAVKFGYKERESRNSGEVFTIHPGFTITHFKTQKGFLLSPVTASSQPTVGLLVPIARRETNINTGGSQAL